MIDLHSHTLPGLCDGSQDMATSLAMARISVEDGVTHLACTPHIYPGIYNNSTSTISPALEAFQAELDKAGIPLKLLIGADTHMVPEVMQGLKQGSIPTLNHSRYFLLEPSHHVPIKNFVDQVQSYLYAGYIPLITHPERLSWAGDHYDDFIEAARQGAWIQITAGAITGHFGRTAKKLAERFLSDGFVHIIASDAHGIDRRPPILSHGVDKASDIIGADEAKRCVIDRPQAILDNADPADVIQAPALRADWQASKKTSSTESASKGSSWFKRLFN